ncbi:MAG: hypothetical protein PHN74_02530 [Candidatus Pacebacteria bacterium]|nr:hypothetical protein [Candidatus Paceibacterota bacterium]
MTKQVRSIILGAVIIIAAVIIAIIINKAGMFGGEKKYAAVYLSTGEIYFGEFSNFMRPKLSNIFLIQQTQDGLAVQKFTNSVWKPKEPMYLNDEQIVFWSRIESDSPIVQAIEGKIQPSAAAPETTQPAAKK